MRLMKNLATLSVLFGFLFAGSAYALTPANSILTNTATLTYTGNTTGITATVDVTVQLVAVAPITTIDGIEAPVDPVTGFTAALPSPVTRAENQDYTETFTVTAQGNGPDTYTLVTTTTPTNSTGDSGSTLLEAGGTTETVISLGATALLEASTGSPTIVVPSDDTIDGSVNGIEAGDTVVINGTPYTVASVVDGGTDGPSSITLTEPVPALPAGTGVYESIDLEIVVADVGTITDPTLDASLLVNVQIIPASDPSLALDINVLINIVNVTIEKFVTNITNPTPALSCVSPEVFATVTYCASGVTAAPNEVLEYLIKVSSAPTVDIDGAVITDLLSAFTTYVAGTTELNNIAVTDNGASPIAPLDLLNSGILVQDDAAVAQAAGAEGSGTVAAGESAFVTYQVTVNP